MVFVFALFDYDYYLFIAWYCFGYVSLGCLELFTYSGLDCWVLCGFVCILVGLVDVELCVT